MVDPETEPNPLAAAAMRAVSEPLSFHPSLLLFLSLSHSFALSSTHQYCAGPPVYGASPIRDMLVTPPHMHGHATRLGNVHL